MNRIKIFRFLGPSDLCNSGLTAYNIRHASGYYLIKENLNIQQTSPHPRSRKVQRCPVMCAKVKLQMTLNGKAAGQFKKPKVKFATSVTLLYFFHWKIYYKDGAINIQI